MQTKKKVFVRGSTRELANPRILRSQKKLTENGQAEEKKVSELITSSVRKPKPAGSISKKHQENVAAINLDASYNLGENDGHNNCLEQGNTHGASVECMGYKGESQCHPMGTIFSPAFHLPKSMGEEISEGVHFLKFFGNGGQTPYQDDKMEYSRVNIFNYHIARRSSDCTSQKDEHSSEVTQISANMGSQSDLEVHTDPPFTASDTRNCVNEVLNAADTNTCCDTGLGSDLSSEVSAIYLAMKSSTQECVGEYDQDSMKTDECIEEDDEELDDFDPYFFIKNLPGLSSVVPTFRPMLLPKQTRSCPSTTLVLDLDETLVHSSLEPCTDIDFTFTVNFNLMEHTIYVRCRPYLKDFMEKVSSLFEIIIFTASQSIYAEQLLNMLDPNRKIFRHRVYRDSCVMVDGNYLKDLSILGRDLARVIIIDNSPQAFGFQVDNGIPIESWFDDRSDQELLLLLPFLESLVGVKDVRPLIAEKFNLRQKIAAAACP